MFKIVPSGCAPETASFKGATGSLFLGVALLCFLTLGRAQAGEYSAEAMDRDMVHVPGGTFLYGMTAAEKRLAAEAKNVGSTAPQLMPMLATSCQ